MIALYNLNIRGVSPRYANGADTTIHPVVVAR